MAQKKVSKYADRAARKKTAQKRHALGKQGDLKNLMDAMAVKK